MLPTSIQRLLVIIALFASTGCVGILGPRDVTVPLQRLQTGIERKFPMSAHPLNLIDLSLSNPRLTLQPGTNRMSTTLDAAVAPAFTQRVWRGNFTLSGVLELDAARGAVIVAQAQVDHIALEGIDPVLADQVARAAGVLAAQILRGSPVYTFGPDDFRYAGTRFVPTRIVTQASGLVVTFEPAK